MKQETADKKLWMIDDGESHWIVATSEGEARAQYLDLTKGDASEIVSISECPMVDGDGDDIEFRVYLPDGYHESERNLHPCKPTEIDGNLFIVATIRDHVTHADIGDIIATSVW
ncbi:MAG: hypothetical protein GY938_16760 [Ketobacter sp.]|nr:hypothetical protein [Ketobacter sp.]